MAAALRRWRANGMTKGDWLRLVGVNYEITDLPGTQIGRVVSQQLIQIDIDAGGYGWFVDSTPGDDVEFSDSDDTSLGIDLLSVVMNELGHVLGIQHDCGLMDATLRPGARHDRLD